MKVRNMNSQKEKKEVITSLLWFIIFILFYFYERENTFQPKKSVEVFLFVIKHSPCTPLYCSFLLNLENIFLNITWYLEGENPICLTSGTVTLICEFSQGVISSEYFKEQAYCKIVDLANKICICICSIVLSLIYLLFSI